MKIKYFQVSYKNDLAETQEARQEPPETGYNMWWYTGYIQSPSFWILSGGS